jgi:hypothetical protein
MTQLSRWLGSVMRATRGILAVALVACAQSTAKPTAVPDPHAPPASEALDTEAPSGKAPASRAERRKPSLREAQVITELMRAAERVRNLQFASRVPVLVENRARITEYVGTQIEEEELERARVVYTALGLLPEHLDVRALLLRLMGEQVVGYYDADEKHLVVRDDIMRGFAKQIGDDAETPSDLAEARIVLLHELVHALQDQHLKLSEHIHAERDTDASNAFHALVEGDATLAMIGYALEREQVPLQRLTGNPAQVRSFSDVVRRSPLAGSELEQAPAIVRVPLLSSYVDGLAFCASLHGSGGFTAVDRAHDEPPVSTEQVLHPERFAQLDRPTPVSLAALPELESAGYEVVREDTLGELEMGVYFGQTGGQDEARRAADGWDGDRIRVYSREGRTAVVWLSVWDSAKDAEQAESAAQRVEKLSHNVGDDGFVHYSDGRQPVRPSYAVYRRGSYVLLLRDIEAELQARISARLLTNPR